MQAVLRVPGSYLHEVGLASTTSAAHACLEVADVQRKGVKVTDCLPAGMEWQVLD